MADSCQNPSLSAPLALADAAAPPVEAVDQYSDLERAELPRARTGSARSQPTLRVIPITRQEHVVRSIGIAREFHQESRYRHIPFSEAKFLRVYGQIVARPDKTFGVLVERDGEIVGVVLAEIGEYFLGSGGLIATNQVLYVSGTVRGTALGGRIAARLMRLFINWAKSKGADEIHIHATSGIDPERTNKFIKRIGFQPYGGNYAVKLKN